VRELYGALALLVTFASCGGRALSIADASAGGAPQGASGGASAVGGASASGGASNAGGASAAGGVPQVGTDAGGSAVFGGAPDTPDPETAGAATDGCPSEPTSVSGAVFPSSLASRYAEELVRNSWDDAPVIGMAANPDGRVYLGTASTIYQVEGSLVNEYLTSVESATSSGLSESEFRGFDIDPRGTLYAIATSTVVRVSQPHVASVWQNAPSLAAQIAVLGVDDILVVSGQTLWRVTPRCALQSLTNGQLIGLDCGHAQLAADPSGSFAYQADCGVQQLYLGISGSGKFGVIYPNDASNIPTGASFACTARDPAGGYYTVVTQDGGWRLAHFSDGPSGAVPIYSMPSLDDMTNIQLTEGQSPDLSRCRLAALADGTVFLQSANTIWKLALTP
jgi:hypothetical protein